MYIEFKQGEKHAQKGADQSEFHEAFQDAGYLLKDTDLVIDFDGLPKESIKAMITMFEIDTQTVWTDRGAHLYFNKPRSFKGKGEMICPLGFKVEYKTIKNTPNGITIKRNGKLRDIDNIGTRSELPECLYINKKLDPLFGLSDGDGRNSKLYKHKFQIMGIDNYKKILRFINSYVFADPLSEEELKTIARDEELLVEKGNEGEIAKSLIRKLKVKKFGNVLYLFDGIRYRADEDFVTIVNNEIPEANTRFIDEVIKKMSYSLFNEKEPKGGWDIKFKNGMLRDGNFHWMTTDDFTPFYIDINYNPDAAPVPIVDEYLDHLSKGWDKYDPDPSYRQLILDIIAHSFITDVNRKRNVEFQKVVFFVGDGGNGKGTLFEVIRSIVGDGNYSTTKLAHLTDERYVYPMKGKLVNLGDDIEDKPIDDKIMTKLKNLTGFDKVQFRKLYGMPVDEAISTSQIFTSNHILKSFEKGNSWKRRVIWAPIYAKPKSYDPHFMNKLLSPEAMEYWVKLAVESYLDLCERGKLTECERVENFTKDYHEMNNGCLQWVRDQDPELIRGKRAPAVYEQYEAWANTEDGQAQSVRALKEAIKEVHGLVIKCQRRDGKTEKVYAEQ